MFSWHIFAELEISRKTISSFRNQNAVKSFSERKEWSLNSNFIYSYGFRRILIGHA